MTLSKVVGDLQQSGIKRSRLESSGTCASISASGIVVIASSISRIPALFGGPRSELPSKGARFTELVVFPKIHQPL